MRPLRRTVRFHEFTLTELQILHEALSALYPGEPAGSASDEGRMLAEIVSALGRVRA